MKKTLSVKVALIFLPAILIFLTIIFVFLGLWKNKTAIEGEQTQLHIAASGVEASLNDKDLDSSSK